MASTFIPNLDLLAPDLSSADANGLYWLSWRALDVASGVPPRKSRVIPYVDPGGATQAGISSWLKFSRDHFGFKGSDLAPLYINGLTKSGKSLVANEVLLSLVRRDPDFGVGQAKEVSVFRLSMDSLPKEYRRRLRKFLTRLASWVKNSIPYSGLPSRRDALSDAVSVLVQPNGGSVEELEQAIQDLLNDIRVPVLVILDEVHSWFLPRGVNDTLDRVSARDAGQFFKDLIISGNGRTLWVATGSSMATFWSNLARVPPNGYSLLVHRRQLDLPLSTERGMMKSYWDAICRSLEEDGKTPPPVELLKGSDENTVAWLAYLMQEWYLEGSPANPYKFVTDTVQFKLVEEAYGDWSVVLAAMTKKQRLTMLSLSSVVMGGIPGELGQLGLKVMLDAYLTPVEIDSNRFYLNSAPHRQIIQMIVDRKGNMTTAWREPRVSATGTYLSHLEAAWMIVLLQNSLGGPGKGIRGQARTLVLEELAATLSTEGPCSEWPEKPWMKVVLDSNNNIEAAMKFPKVNQEGAVKASEMLGWYLRLLRNCLAHQVLQERSGGGASDGSREGEAMKEAMLLPQPASLVKEGYDTNLIDLCPLASTPFGITNVLAAAWRRHRKAVTEQVALPPQHATSSGRNGSGRRRGGTEGAAPGSRGRASGPLQAQAGPMARSPLYSGVMAEGWFAPLPSRLIRLCPRLPVRTLAGLSPPPRRQRGILSSRLAGFKI